MSVWNPIAVFVKQTDPVQGVELVIIFRSYFRLQ